MRQCKWFLSSGIGNSNPFCFFIFLLQPATWWESEIEWLGYLSLCSRFMANVASDIVLNYSSIRVLCCYHLHRLIFKGIGESVTSFVDMLIIWLLFPHGSRSVASTGNDIKEYRSEIGSAASARLDVKATWRWVLVIVFSSAMAGWRDFTAEPYGPKYLLLGLLIPCFCWSWNREHDYPAFLITS
jgi:hypothetical protein